MVKNNQNFVLKIVFITKISKTFDFFGQKSKKKIVMFFSVLSYGITLLQINFELKIIWMNNLDYGQVPVSSGCVTTWLAYANMSL